MERRKQERDALLEQLVTLIQGDQRFVAAWLWGSLGRGRGDAWSDLDLWIVAEDDYYTSLVSDFARFLAPLSPLFVMEQPVNGPPGGTAFNVAVIGGETGAQNVDFDLLPQSRACIGSDCRLLFDRAGLPHINQPLSTGGNPEAVFNETERLLQETRFYFLMWLVCAKYIVRDPDGERMGLFSYVIHAQNAVHRLFGDAPLFLETTPPISSTPSEKIAILRHSLSDMTTYLPRIRSQTENASISCEIHPDIAVPSLRFLDTVALATQDTDTCLANSGV